MTKIQLKDLPFGAYFKRKPTAKKEFIRDEYCRSLKKYFCMPENDVWGSGLPLKGSTVVYID
jgi:hypothetical protein